MNIDLKQENVLINPPIQLVCEHILKFDEGKIGQSGAMMIDTGEFTGRSPKDKYFVEEDFSKDNLWWGEVNKKVDVSIFNKLYQKIINYYKEDNRSTYVFEGFAGSDDVYKLPIRVIAKKAWQHLFCRNMFININKKQKKINPEFTIINASEIINEDFKVDGMNSEVFIIIFKV